MSQSNSQIYEVGTYIFREGDEGKLLYIIQSGKVQLLKGEDEEIVCTLEAGEFFGELSIINQRPRSTSARVIEDAKLLLVDGPTFSSMIKNNAEIAVRVIRKLAGELDQAELALERQKAERERQATRGHMLRLVASAGQLAQPSASEPSVGPEVTDASVVLLQDGGTETPAETGVGALPDVTEAVSELPDTPPKISPPVPPVYETAVPSVDEANSRWKVVALAALLFAAGVTLVLLLRPSRNTERQDDSQGLATQAPRDIRETEVDVTGRSGRHPSRSKANRGRVKQQRLGTKRKSKVTKRRKPPAATSASRRRAASPSSRVKHQPKKMITKGLKRKSVAKTRGPSRASKTPREPTRASAGSARRKQSEAAPVQAKGVSTARTASKVEPRKAANTAARTTVPAAGTPRRIQTPVTAKRQSPKKAPKAERKKPAARRIVAKPARKKPARKKPALSASPAKKKKKKRREAVNRDKDVPIGF